VSEAKAPIQEPAAARLLDLNVAERAGVKADRGQSGLGKPFPNFAYRAE
jgi:hypothetical protein